MSKPYRIAIIGVGAIGGIHAESITHDLENAELVAGSHLNPEAAKSFCEQYECAPYDDFERMLEEQKPDAAIVTTPSGAHLEPVLACAQRGIHVLCEKPLEISTERTDRMIKAAADAGVVLGSVFQMRFNPVLETVHQAVVEGRFGKVSAINAWVPWWREDSYYGPGRWQGTLAMDGGGALMNQSIHVVDTIQWLGGTGIPGLRPDENPVQDVFCFKDKLGHDPELIEVEDTAVAVLRFRNGTIGTIFAATSMYPGSSRRLLVGGRDGTAEVQEEELLQFDFRNAQPEDEEIRERFSAKAQAGGAADPLSIGRVGHTRNISGFLEALEKGESPELDGIQARKAVAIIQAIYQSADEGKPVRVA